MIVYMTSKGATRREHIMECKFASLTVEQVAYLVSADVDAMIVTHSKIREIENVFDLCNPELDGEGITAIRNRVVDTLAQLTSNARERGNFELFQQLHNNMSGITAVIDNIMFAREFVS